MGKAQQRLGDNAEATDELDSSEDEVNPDSLELPEVPGLPTDIAKMFQVYEWRNSLSILKNKYPAELEDIYKCLRTFSLKRSEILTPGGNLSPISKALNGAFDSRGWFEVEFKTQFRVRGFKRRKDKAKVKTDESEKPVFDKTYKTPTHNVDCFKPKIALEIEWSNKDPFFDRDLNNFRLLFDLRAVDVGVIITKSDLLMPEMKKNRKVWQKYGNSTTWFGKLKPRIDGGGAGGCPVLVFAIRPEKILQDVKDEDVEKFINARESERNEKRARDKEAKEKRKALAAQKKT